MFSSVYSLDAVNFGAFSRYFTFVADDESFRMLNSRDSSLVESLHEGSQVGIGRVSIERVCTVTPIPSFKMVPRV